MFLSERNLAFRGSNEKLFEPNNGNFFGVIELLSDFVPELKMHLKSITETEKRVTSYFSPKIQNEIILQLASRVLHIIVSNIKSSKYFSAMIDSTPDFRKKDQLSIIIRYVKIADQKPSVQESFLSFVNIISSTGENLANFLIEELKVLGIKIADYRGQSYDNASNMKGEYKGVKSRILEINNKALYTPCGGHDINLVIGDSVKNTIKSQNYFTTLNN